MSAVNRPIPVAGCPGVYRYQDCCNVYVLVAEGRATLIDLGSGAALDCLADVGATRVEDVYFTHAHRDQCQGAARALEQGLRLHFPREAYAFVDADRRSDLSPPTPLLRGYVGRFEPPRRLPASNMICAPAAGSPSRRRSWR